MEAPVVPTMLARTAPKASSSVFASGLPLPLTSISTPPETMNSPPTSAMKA